jgi:predicted HicB family RNase H-like nuclease
MSAKTKKRRIRELSARYPRVIEWRSAEDAFIGSAPPLIGQCCHGDTEAEVAKQLAAIVDDLVEDMLDGKMPEPKQPADKTYSGKFLVRITPELHKKAALKAMSRGESLNQFVADAISAA